MSPKYYTPAHFLWKDARGQIRSSIKPANKNMSKKEKKDVQNSQGKHTLPKEFSNNCECLATIVCPNYFSASI